MPKKEPPSRKETTPRRFVLHAGFFLIGVRMYKPSNGGGDAC